MHRNRLIEIKGIFENITLPFPLTVYVQELIEEVEQYNLKLEQIHYELSKLVNDDYL